MKKAVQLLFSQLMSQLFFQQRKSNHRVVALRDLSLGSSGTYTCEASSEAPRFKTVSGAGNMQVCIIGKKYISRRVKASFFRFLICPMDLP